MKKENILCNPMLVSRFSDREFGSEEYAEISRHIQGCSSCQKELRTRQSLSSLFKTAFDQRVAKAEPIRLEAELLEKIRRKKETWLIRLRKIFGSKTFLVPAASLAAMLILFFTFIKYPTAPAAGPSAIITSLTGNISSVIIIETPESRQTVIWFDETL